MEEILKAISGCSEGIRKQEWTIGYTIACRWAPTPHDDV